MVTFLQDHRDEIQQLFASETRQGMDVLPPTPSSSSIDFHLGNVEDVGADLIAARAHPLYAWLRRNQHYRRAREKFDKLRRKRQPHAPEQLRDEREFLVLVVNVAGLYFEEVATEARKTKRQKERIRILRRQAVGASRKLRGLLNQGIALSQPRPTRRLALYLKQLEEELSARKPYDGPTGLARKYCELFAEHFYFSFGRGSVPVLSAWAAMIGYTPDIATIERYVKRAKTLWMHREMRMGRRRPAQTDGKPIPSCGCTNR